MLNITIQNLKRVCWKWRQDKITGFVTFTLYSSVRSMITKKEYNHKYVRSVLLCYLHGDIVMSDSKPVPVFEVGFLPKIKLLNK